MKLVMFLLSLILVINLVNGAVIKGNLVNSSSGLPVASARLSFRTGDITPYPTAISNAAGLFVTQLGLPMNFLLQVSIETGGYCTKIIEIHVTGDTVDVGTISLEELSGREIRFLGTVTDSLSHQPVNGAIISIARYQGDFKPYLDFLADTAGSYSQKVVVSNEYLLVCTVSSSGYYPTSFGIPTTMDTVYRSVLLRPVGSIRVMASGHVVDSKTGQPVQNVRVILQTNYHDATPDTSYTNSTGMFSRSVKAGITSSAIPTLGCNISAEGYTSYSAHVFVNAPQTVNFQEITLVNITGGDIVKTLPQKSILLPVNKTSCAFVSLNGKYISRMTDIRARNNVSSLMVLKMLSGGTSEKNRVQFLNLNQ